MIFAQNITKHSIRQGWLRSKGSVFRSKNTQEGDIRPFHQEPLMHLNCCILDIF